MINGVDYYYYWHHDKEYPRLKFSDLNDEACLNLAEAMLLEIRDAYQTTARGLHLQADEKAIGNANNLLKVLRGDTINGLTLGHGKEVANEFLSMCPKKLIKTNAKGEKYLECERKDDPVENKAQPELQPTG